MASWTRRIENLINHHFASSGKPAKHTAASRSERIVEQVKFYFSDSNLQRDEFMLNIFASDPFGWLGIKQLVHEFPILKHLQVSEYEIISICGKDDFFLLDLPNRRIRRNFSLYPNLQIEAILTSKSAPASGQMSLVERRTVCIDKVPILLSLTEIKDALTSQFPKIQIKYVSIPRHGVTGESLGTIFVEFGSESDAKSVIRELKHLPDHEGRHLFRTESHHVCPMTMGKFRALKAAYKSAKSLKIQNRLGYFLGYQPRDDMVDCSDVRMNASSCSSSVMSGSEIDSLAQDSVDVRRSCSASSIRSDSVVLLSGIAPSVSLLQLRVWLSHFGAVQFIDFQQTSCHVRLASRRERDFFLKDLKQGLNGVPLVSEARALTPEECIEYFETERQRRRDTAHAGDATYKSSDRTVSTCIPILTSKSTPPRPGCFTDIMTGNPGTREPGTSILRGITKGRHVAREKFRTVLESLHHEETPLVDVSNFEINAAVDFIPNSGTIDAQQRLNLPNRNLKRDRIETNNSPSKFRRTIPTKKTTRRGKRGGRNIKKH